MGRDIDQINVIPLVDVMLVLLVIVLTTATFITTGQVPVQLAKAQAASDRKDVPLIVTLTAEGGGEFEERFLQALGTFGETHRAAQLLGFGAREFSQRHGELPA